MLGKLSRLGGDVTAPFSFMKKLFKPMRPREFSLGKRGRPGIPRAREDVVEGKHTNGKPFATRDAESAGSGFWGSIRQNEAREAPTPEDLSPKFNTPFGGMPEEERNLLGQDFSRSLEDNLKSLRAVFHSPRNRDLVVRRLLIKAKQGPVKAAVLHLVGMVDDSAIREDLLVPLQRANTMGARLEVKIESLQQKYIAEIQTNVITKVGHAVSSIVEGESILLVDGQPKVLACDTRSPEHRPISESPTEAVVRGPHTGFVENLRANIALVRGIVQSPSLVSEYYYLGARSHVPVCIMYMEGIVNPKLVEEVRKRISSLRVDNVGTIDSLMCLIQDSPRDPFPTHISTERPDKVAAMIEEGHVALLDNTPSAGLVPGVVWSLMHSSEDYYIHFIPGSAIRLLRWLALFFTVYASAAYVAVVTYHPAMIPTELMFALAASREQVPFPAALEVLAMEVSFELIREAGIRIPSIVGPTIGIVGAVVLGQAAVQASIVSPVLVVVVSISGLGSFAIPNYNLSLYARIAKFVMILSAAALGIPGITFTTLMLGAHIVSLRSFGVPVTAPLVPHWPHSTDIIVRGPLQDMTDRPGSTRPLDSKRRLKSETVGPAPQLPLEEKRPNPDGQQAKKGKGQT